MLHGFYLYAPQGAQNISAALGMRKQWNNPFVKWVLVISKMIMNNVDCIMSIDPTMHNNPKDMQFEGLKCSRFFKC